MHMYVFCLLWSFEPNFYDLENLNNSVDSSYRDIRYKLALTTPLTTLLSTLRTVYLKFIMLVIIYSTGYDSAQNQNYYLQSLTCIYHSQGDSSAHYIQSN